MALYPCMACGERFSGEARNVYMTLFRGQRRLRLRNIVCPSCEDDLVAGWVAKALFKDADGAWEQWLEGMPEDRIWTISDDPQSMRNAWDAWRATSERK